MKFNMNSRFCCSVMFVCCLLWFSCSEGMSCDSCGRECANACGTKHFRTCCFNYLRKRNSPMELVELDNSHFASAENKFDNWLKDTREMENVIRRISNFDKSGSGINSKKRHSNEEFPEFP